MQQIFRSFILTMTAFAFVAFCSCNSGKENNGLDTTTADSVAVTDDQQTYSNEVLPAETAEYEAADEPEEAPATTAKPKQSNPGIGGRETLYISTFGANGKVWGHVTMNGNTGRGTIHDDDENTLSITVRRHGGELYGIDQNGREYVFRL